MLLELKELNYKYPGSVGDVFRDLSCRVTEPGFHALFGPSGVGKTTLAKIITGEIGGFAGEISTRGTEQVLYTFNLERLPGWYTIQEHLEEVTPAANKEKIKALFPERCFLYISHNVVEVSKFCKQILVLRSHHKNPQAISLQGLDFREGRDLTKMEIEQSMLEIVNAA
jgi:ABC-type nitrate/sulfonate/bicarbonate transport system ATPase subunit